MTFRGYLLSTNPRRKLSPPAMGEVHVWSIDLDGSNNPDRENFKTLSDDEKERADRFHFNHGRLHYIRCRSALRRLLSSYTGVSPEEISFSYNEFGKPTLCGFSDFELKFNVSHSHGIGAIAVAVTEVGLDIESIDPTIEVDAIARLAFSRSEQILFQHKSSWEKIEYFFEHWAKKEAYIKGIGLGFSAELQAISISEGIMGCSVQDEVNSGQAWFIKPCIISPDTRAAVALNHIIHNIIVRSWADN